MEELSRKSYIVVNEEEKEHFLLVFLQRITLGRERYLTYMNTINLFARECW